MSVKLIHARSLAVLPAIEPLLLPDNDGAVTRKMLVQTLERALIEDSENLMLLVALDEDSVPGEEIKAFVIAYAPAGLNYVFIDQMWIDAQTSHLLNLSGAMFDAIKAWARNMDRSFVRMETQRDPRAFTKKFGFSPISTTMQFSLEQKDEVLQEFAHEQKQGSKDDVHDDQPAEGHQHGDHELPLGEDGTDSNAVRRDESITTVVDVPASAGPDAG